MSLRTPEQVREEFVRCGVSIAEWSRANGYSPQLVYRVIQGSNASRGKSHEIAVRLGIKNGEFNGLEALRFQ
jgi:gp16 family phage-associated protein